MSATTASSALRSCARSPAVHRPAAPRHGRLPPVTAASFRRAASTSTRFAGSSRSSSLRAPLAGSAIALLLTAYWLRSKDDARWINVAQADEPTKHMDLDQSPVHRELPHSQEAKGSSMFIHASPSPLYAVDPDTKMAFPSTLSPRSLSHISTPLELVGLGVRTVCVSTSARLVLPKLTFPHHHSSFLRVQVYSVGTYFAPEALQRLKGSQPVRR